jgi:hypothetical protein
MNFHDLLTMIVEDPAGAEAAIRLDPSALTRRDKVGETLLHYFAVENDLPRVIWLHRLGASIDIPDEFGATPLMHAVQLEYRELLEYFLAQGANVDAKTVNGDTALSYAVMAGKEALAKRILCECRQNIQYYFDPIDAQTLVYEASSDIQHLVVSMGLIDPNGDKSPF